MKLMVLGSCEGEGDLSKMVEFIIATLLGKVLEETMSSGAQVEGGLALTRRDGYFFL